MRDAITDGRLPAGARLPATRLLAGQLGVSRGVVVEAYQRLTDEGLLGGRRGGGTTVLAAAPVDRSRPGRAGAAPARRSTCAPACPTCPRSRAQAWLRAERAALARTPDAALGYGDPRGTLELRTALATWLARSRGVRADPSGIVVVNGVAQGLALLAQVLARRGVTTVGYEDPGSRGTRDQLERWGLALAPVPVDDLGADVDALGRTGSAPCSPPRRTSTRPASSSPRRAGAPSWSGPRDGGLVIEDDYDAEHRYDRAPVAALAALAPEHVVYLGSVSKTLAPALRLGWVVAPPDVREELVVRKQWSDITSPALRPAGPRRAHRLREPSSGTCGRSAPASAPAATRCSTPCATHLPACPRARRGRRACTCSSASRTASTTRPSPSAPSRPASRCSRCRTTACVPGRPAS